MADGKLLCVSCNTLKGAEEFGFNHKNEYRGGRSNECQACQEITWAANDMTHATSFDEQFPFEDHKYLAVEDQIFECWRKPMRKLEAQAKSEEAIIELLHEYRKTNDLHKDLQFYFTEVKTSQLVVYFWSTTQKLWVMSKKPETIGRPLCQIAEYAMGCRKKEIMKFPTTPDSKLHKRKMKMVKHLDDIIGNLQTVAKYKNVGTTASLCLCFQDETFPQKLNQRPNCIACADGKVLEFHPLKVRDRNQDDLFSIAMPIRWNPRPIDSPEHQKLAQTIADIAKGPAASSTEQGNKARYQYLQELMGYAMLPTNPDKFGSVWTGSKNGGKSMLLNLMSKVLGDYAKSDSGAMKEGSDSRKGSASPHLADLQFVRLLYTTELEGNIDSNSWKRLVGNDKIVARGLYAANATFTSQIYPIMAKNGMATTSRNDGDTSIVDKIRYFNFARMYVREDEQDKNDPDQQVMDPSLEQELSTPEHLEALFQWLVEGLHRYLEKGFTRDEALMQELKDFREETLGESDPLKRFVMECITFDNVVEPIGTATILEGYKTFCFNNHLHPKYTTAAGFGKAIAPHLKQHLDADKSKSKKSNVYKVKVDMPVATI